MTPKWLAKILNGKLKIFDKDMFDMYLSTLPEDVEVIVRKITRQRTNPQNKYYGNKN